MSSAIVPLDGLRLDPSWVYVVREHPAANSGFRGGQFICRFPNGYGVSAVRFMDSRGVGSYGADRGLFELAVVEYNGSSIDDYGLTYDTPITEDVIGHLTIHEVADIMDQVAALEPTIGGDA